MESKNLWVSIIQNSLHQMNTQKIMTLETQTKKKFVFDTENKKYIYVWEGLVSSGKSDKIVEYFSEERFIAIKYPYAYGNETFTLCFFEKKSLLKKKKVQHKKMSITVYMKKMMK